MVYYEVIVYTSNREGAVTLNDVFIKLVGTIGESKRTKLKSEKLTSGFSQGEVSSFTVSCDTSLGRLIWIELDKQSHDMFPVDTWFPDKVEVKSEEELTFTFPIYCWINDSEVHCFIEGTAQKGSDTCGRVAKTRSILTDNILEYFRKQDLEKRKKNYCWKENDGGLPHCIQADSVWSLPTEVWFSLVKGVEIGLTQTVGLASLKLKGLADCMDNWKNFDDIGCVFSCKTTKLSEHIQERWRHDDFFAYQFLNGANPMVIQRCTALPSNFPVTDDMLLHGQSLADEMKNGNIFLCNYKNFDGVQPNIINGKAQYLMAPLVLLQKTPNDKLMPIAIQLKQTPADDNPIFGPNDPKYDWLLAKTFVRSAEFTEHELNSHLLRTHLLAEVFAVSLLRSVSMVHPLYKLLMPHTRYTLQINILARKFLVSDTGFFKMHAASGGEALITILQRSLSSLTYRSLCIPDDIADRGLESVPNFYYRDDGLRLWNIINSFVKGILKYYYKSDKEVQNDSELQNWIGDIFEHGFLSRESSGIPQRFSTVDELVKFVTMVIFTCSAQHSAVNTGQFDYGGFMPNTPITLQLPPPIKKGLANENTLLQTLPMVSETVNGMAVMWLLSKPSSDFVALGQYREEYFTEETACEVIKVFQEELKKLSEGIKKRNESLEIPYTYMDPALMENSVAI
ncbi:arachidonate 15-lipoxygenase B-like [Anabas testudineus]|uniref:arachidonate 15-lipoxygenase B-like n=1 Tax=Anabas testudineus TaxID=64144 RepID=UPI000E456D44|nr:arachidonate 15-lipoxygenase B-like [Anabas testudineus]